LIIHGEQGLSIPPLKYSNFRYETNNFIGHKNGLYQPLLAEKLPYSSFRFDLHGVGDSEGETSYGDLDVSVLLLLLSLSSFFKLIYILLE
jgi:hypothetical protein